MEGRRSLMAIVFIQAQNGLVLIRYGFRAEFVLATVQRYHPFPLSMIRVVPGSGSAEPVWRAHWADAALDNGWFHWRNDMLTWRPSDTQGANRKQKRPEKPPSERKKAILARILEADASFTVISKEFGLTRERIRQIAKKAGHTPATLGHENLYGQGRKARAMAAQERLDLRARAKAELSERIANLRKQGLRQRDIAEKGGISQRTVSKILNASGLRSMRRGVRVSCPDGPKSPCSPWSRRNPALLLSPRAPGGGFAHTDDKVQRARDLWEQGLSA